MGIPSLWGYRSVRARRSSAAAWIALARARIDATAYSAACSQSAAWPHLLHMQQQIRTWSSHATCSQSHVSIPWPWKPGAPQMSHLRILRLLLVLALARLVPLSGLPLWGRAGASPGPRPGEGWRRACGRLAAPRRALPHALWIPTMDPGSGSLGARGQHGSIPFQHSCQSATTRRGALRRGASLWQKISSLEPLWPIPLILKAILEVCQEIFGVPPRPRPPEDIFCHSTFQVL